MNKFLGWRANINVAENYINAVKSILSSEQNFKNFRSGNNSYTPILEHLNQHEGQIYANYIIKNYPDLIKHIDKFKENDKIGNPITFNYDEFGIFNPTTIRYIKFLGDIIKRFENLENINLVEIGGGYGGLVKILTTRFNFNSIQLFDLPEPLLLQKKYLEQFNINVETHLITDEFNIQENTLVISNYAWCECDRETRDIYKNKILNKSKYVFMVVYDVDINNELMNMNGKSFLEKETLNECKIFSLIQ